MKKLLFSLLLTGCTAIADTPKIEPNETDSVIIKSKETVVSSIKTFEQVDKSINKKVSAITKEITQLKEENKALVKAPSIKVIVRDTVYITEKKNFWGKTKVTKDSSKGIVDTLENQ